MRPLRVLVLSSTRPSRSWKIADRIRREIRGVEIRGIVQAPLPLLAPAQRWMAQGADPCAFSSSRAMQPIAWLHFIWACLMHWILWCIHGCPRGLNLTKKFTIEDLGSKCRQTGCQFFLAKRFDHPGLNQFVVDHEDLAVVLGELPLDAGLLSVPKLGVVRVCQSDAAEAATTKQKAHISLKLLKQPPTSSCTLVSLDVPAQPYDGPLGLTLKTDLIADDLLIESIKLLQVGGAEEASQKLASWTRQIITPYLIQLESAIFQSALAPPPLQRFRRIWKLVLDTLLLCSPILVARNWYRRWRGRYPVLVLTHHLVSDRPHRMGISTEHFWRQLQFLRRHYYLTSLVNAEQILRAGKAVLPTAVVTFDDGYRDNFINLRAVANELEIPVSLFVSTKPIEHGQEFQHDMVQERTGHLALTWEQILYWHSQGAEFGSHTRTHLDCGSKDRAILKDEIIGSKLDLEGRLREQVRFFAFPFGQMANMSVEAMEIAASAYALCFAGLDGENLPFAARSAPYLYRKDIYPNRWELELELQSIFLFIKRCREKLSPNRAEFQSWKTTVPAYVCSPSSPLSPAGPKDD